MLSCFTTRKNLTSGKKTIPIDLIVTSELESWLAQQKPFIQHWVAASNFKAESYSYCLLPDDKGQLAHVYVGTQEINDFWTLGNLAYDLPSGIYEFNHDNASVLKNAVIAWALGAYRFNRYKKESILPAQLLLSDSLIEQEAQQLVHATYLVRDLINTPTEYMGPAQLAEAVIQLGQPFSTVVNQIVGEDLIRHNYPAIHAVGRASNNSPRLIDLRWGEKTKPKLTLVGKGVCFDSGGLDLKSSSGMALMKKDMGGAANVLGLAYMIMATNLPVNLRVLIPAVENAVSGNAYRPGDIIATRKGLYVEVGNTDAEGRLILADALTEAVTEKPDFLIDFATLTGAARVALGPDLPALFCNKESISADLASKSKQEQDQLWPMPLYQPYREYLNSPFADINNNSSNPYGGAIAAALFLQEFVGFDQPWGHIDLMAWNMTDRPGRPQGGEAMGLRAVWEFLRERYQ